MNWQLALPICISVGTRSQNMERGDYPSKIFWVELWFKGGVLNKLPHEKSTFFQPIIKAGERDIPAPSFNTQDCWEKYVDYAIPYLMRTLICIHNTTILFVRYQYFIHQSIVLQVGLPNEIHTLRSNFPPKFIQILDLLYLYYYREDIFTDKWPFSIPKWPFFNGIIR